MSRLPGEAASLLVLLAAWSACDCDTGLAFLPLFLGFPVCPGGSASGAAASPSSPWVPLLLSPS
eukprot:8531473-Heterocapsa_arctica.AAC.1